MSFLKIIEFMPFVVQNKLRFEVMINSSRMFLYFQKDAIILFAGFYKCLIFHYLFCLGGANEKKRAELQNVLIKHPREPFFENKNFTLDFDVPDDFGDVEEKEG